MKNQTTGLRDIMQVYFTDQFVVYTERFDNSEYWYWDLAHDDSDIFGSMNFGKFKADGTFERVVALL